MPSIWPRSRTGLRTAVRTKFILGYKPSIYNITLRKADLQLREMVVVS